MNNFTFFPFGFRPIVDSRDKYFEIELSSLNEGRESNALQFVSSNPLVVTGYKFSKDEILSSKDNFVYFILKKLDSITKLVNIGENSLITISAVKDTLTYFFPFVFYLVFRIAQEQKRQITKQTYARYKAFKFLYREKKQTIKEIMFYLIVGLIIIDLFDTTSTNNFFTVMLMVMMIVLFVISRFTSKKAYVVSFIFLGFCVLLATYNSMLQIIINRATFWSYIFLLVGLAQDLRAQVAKPKKYQASK